MRTIALFAFFLTAATLHAELIAPNGSKQLPNYRTSWLGNTYGGLNPGYNTGEGVKGQWVQQDIAAICVTPDGTVYTNIPWEEAGGNCSMYKDGEMLGFAGHTHGWGRNGGKAVAVNDKYVYIALMGNNEGGGLDDTSTWPPKGYDWYGVCRRLRSDFTKGAPFDHGKGGKGDTLPKSFLVVNEVSNEKGSNAIDGPGAVTGLWADNERLYVANPLENRIEIYDVETMGKMENWDLKQYGFSEPGQIAADQKGNIWVYHAEFTKEFNPSKYHTITQFDRNGKKMEGRVSDDGTISAIGPFCFGPDNKMYVFNGIIGILSFPLPENGFDIAGEAVGIIGQTGSIPFFPASYPRGEFGDLQFKEMSVKAIGCDAADNIYIAQDLSTNGGGTVLESYKLTGKETSPPDWFQLFGGNAPSYLESKLNWRLFGLCFIDCAALDPDDETIVYTKEEKYKLDWSQTEPGKEWSFIATTTLIPWHDPRFRVKDSAGVWVRNFLGRKFLFVNDMNAQWMQVYCFPSDKDIKKMSEENEDSPLCIPPIHTAQFYAFFAGKKPTFEDGDPQNRPKEDGEWIYRGIFDTRNRIGKNEPTAQGWWVDSECNVWRASEKEGIRRFRNHIAEWLKTEEGKAEIAAEGLNIENLDFVPEWSFATMDAFPHPPEFNQVKRIRYYPETDTLYLGGCATVDGVEHKNQHWKPMGPVLARYDNYLKNQRAGGARAEDTEAEDIGAGDASPPVPRWKIVLPYVVGSQGHESCEPMGFDAAGDYIFVPYTGASKVSGFKTGHVEVLRADNASPVGWMEPDPKTVGEIGLQDIRECLSAHRLKGDEYVIFLEDDYKAKVVIYRWKPE